MGGMFVSNVKKKAPSPVREELSELREPQEKKEMSALERYRLYQKVSHQVACRLCREADLCAYDVGREQR